MTYQWDWQLFLRDTGGGQTYLDWLFSAWGWTLSVSAAAWIVALCFGVIIGTLRTSFSLSLRVFGAAWVEVFRNIPLLLQIFVWYFVLPVVFPALQVIPPFILVVFALGFFTSARVAEQVRAGIQSLPKGQMMAGSALGLNTIQTYRYVVLPVALRRIIPPLTSEAMAIIKNSSVAFAVSITELTLFAIQAQEETSRGVEVYLAVTALYTISALIVNSLMRLVEHSFSVPGMMGRKP